MRKTRLTKFPKFLAGPEQPYSDPPDRREKLRTIVEDLRREMNEDQVVGYMLGRIIDKPFTYMTHVRGDEVQFHVKWEEWTVLYKLFPCPYPMDSEKDEIVKILPELIARTRRTAGIMLVADFIEMEDRR